MTLLGPLLLHSNLEKRKEKKKGENKENLLVTHQALRLIVVVFLSSFKNDTDSPKYETLLNSATFQVYKECFIPK